MNVERARLADRPAIMNVLDGADLSIDADTVGRRIEADTVLVAGRHSSPIGVLVAIPRPQGAHVEAIAVRRRRRNQGIGTALMEAAADRWGRLTAAFDPAVCDFYRSLAFDVERRGERCWGERDLNERPASIASETAPRATSESERDGG
ncbi:MAG: GNAT family N-acetyltransferase [Halanaeroarchaeum sp.]